jgi:hypothetical protein
MAATQSTVGPRPPQPSEKVSCTTSPCCSTVTDGNPHQNNTAHGPSMLRSAYSFATGGHVFGAWVRSGWGMRHRGSLPPIVSIEIPPTKLLFLTRATDSEMSGALQRMSTATAKGRAPLRLLEMEGCGRVRTVEEDHSAFHRAVSLTH